MCSVHCTLQAVHSTLFTVRCSLYAVHCKLYNIRCTVYRTHCKEYRVHITHPTVLHRTIKHCTVLHCTELHCTALHGFVLHCDLNFLIVSYSCALVTFVLRNINSLSCLLKSKFILPGPWKRHDPAEMDAGRDGNWRKWRLAKA